MIIQHLGPAAMRIYLKTMPPLFAVVAEVGGRPEIIDTARDYNMLHIPPRGCVTYEVDGSNHWWTIQVLP